MWCQERQNRTTEALRPLPGHHGLVAPRQGDRGDGGPGHPQLHPGALDQAGEASARPITSFGIYTRTRNAADTGWIVDAGDSGTTDANGWIYRTNAGAGATSITVTGMPSNVRQQVRVFARAEQSGQTPPILYGDDSDFVEFTTPVEDTPPVLSTTTLPSVNGAALTLTYNEALDTGSVPAAGSYIVRVNGSATAASSVAIAGRAVTLTLATAVTAGEKVTVSYAVPRTNPVQDAAGNDAAALMKRFVVNALSPRTLTWAGGFTESAANDGSVTGSVTATLANDTFAADAAGTGNFDVGAELPTGLTAVATRTSDTVVTFTLTGKATNHADADDVSVTAGFADEAFTGGAGLSSSARQRTFAVDFNDPAPRTLTWAGGFTESAANDGSVSGSVTATLANDSFVADAAGTGNFDVGAELPTGLTAVATRTSDTVVTITLTGRATNHADADDVSVIAGFADEAFTGGAGLPSSTRSRAFTIDFNDPAPRTLTWAGGFTESAANDGSVSGSVTATLANDSFVADAAGTGNFDVGAELPTGLTAVATRTSDTVVTITLTGRATNHADADDVSVTAGFADEAFTGGAGLPSSTRSRAFTIDFNDPAPRTLTWAGGFTESAANDGSVSGSVTATLANDSFVADAAGTGNFDVGAELPTGLTAVATRTSDTVVTITLTGRATNHADADDVSVIAGFADEAFTGGAGLPSSTRSRAFTIDFNDPAPRTLTWAGGFTESAANDGSVTGSVTATLANDTFVADVVSASRYSAVKVPAGLRVAAARTGDSVVTFTLTGNATDHADADDVSNLDIAFFDSAFAGGSGIPLSQRRKGDIGVNYIDSAMTSAPTADAGADRTVNTGTRVTLIGRGTDPDAGDTLSYAWEQTGGTPTVTLTGADTATARFTAPTGLTDDAALTFTLTVTDSMGNTDTDTVTVTVGAHPAAAFGAASYRFDLAENADGGTTPVGVGLVSAIHPDGHTVSYSIAAGDTGNVFAINASSGVLTYTGSGENFESFRIPANAYTLTVRGRTRYASAHVTVTVRVTDVDTEAPSAPSAPTFGRTTETTLVVNWTEPANAGPAITDYDVQYREGASGSWMSHAHDGTATTATLTGLTEGRSYQVQVLAKNAEGSSPWSASGTATPAPDTTAPSLVSATIAERTLTLTYSEGLDTGSVPAAGAFSLRVDGFTRTPSSVSVSGRTVALTLTTAVAAGQTVTVTYDPARATSRIRDLAHHQARLLNNRAVANETPGVVLSTSRLTLAEGGSGTYTVRLAARPSASVTIAVTSSNTDVTVDDTDTDTTGVQNTLTFTTANWNTAQTVTVRAAEDENTASESVTLTHAVGGAGEYDRLADPGLPVAVNDNDAANAAPAFAADTATRSFVENTAAGTDIGAPLTATDADSGDTLTYTLGGADADSFDLDSTSGQLSTKSGVVYDHEARASYTVAVSVSDGNGGSDSIDVTVEVTDDDTEAPGAPLAPTFGDSTATGLAVRWQAPANTGPAITDYDVQYRLASTAPSGEWTAHAHDGAGTSASIGSLVPNSTYQVQVRATNAEGTGDWSPSGTDTTGTNAAPAFGATSYSFTLAENDDGSTTAVAVGTVSATDADAGHTVTYSIAAGDDEGVFAIGASSGAITYTGSGENFEGFTDPAGAFALTVRASDGAGGVADVTVTVAVSDDDTEAPGAPAAPGVTATADSLTGIDVSWTAPDNAGPAITGYGVEYRLASSAPSGSWTSHTHAGTGTTASVGGLQEDTEYQVRVRATNAEGIGDWSAIGTGSTADTTAPTLVSAVVNRATLVLTYDEALDPSSVPAAASFDPVRVDGSNVQEGNVRVSGRTVTLTLTPAVTDGQTVTFRYFPAASSPRIQDLAGNHAADLNYRVAATNITDTTAPALDTATVAGTALTLTYDEPLDTGSVPAAGAFPVTVAGSARTVSSVAVAGSAVTLTLASPAAPGQAVTVAYTKPDANPIQDAAGNEAPSFAAMTATDATPGIVLSPAALTVGEGGAATYTVRLNTAPTGTVTVTVARAPGGSTDVTFDTSTDAGTQRTLTFTTSDWSTARTVTVRAAEDADTENDEATLAHTASGGGYASYSANLPVTVTDDDTGTAAAPVVTVSASATSIEEGAAVTLTFTASPAPTTATEVFYTVAGGTAFGLPTGEQSVTISAGETTATAVLQTEPDDPADTDATMTVTLSDPTTTNEPYSLGDATSVAVRVTQSTAPTVALAAAPATITEGEAVTLTFTADKAAPAAGLAVKYVISGGVAFGLPIQQTVQTATVAPGRTVATVVHETDPDASSGDDGTLTFTLEPSVSPAGAAYLPGTPAHATVTVRQDTTAPALSTATVFQSALTLTYDEALDTGSVPAAGAFPVTVGGTARTVSSVAVAGSAVTLTLASPAAAGQAVTVAYEKPASNPVRDAAGNEAPSFAAMTATNATLGAPAAPTVAATAGSSTSLDVSWTAPTHTGPAITGYDLRYKTSGGADFRAGPQDVTGTSAAITGLTPGTSYQVQVRATNAVGDGAWSSSGTGATTSSAAPVITKVEVSRNLALRDEDTQTFISGDEIQISVKFHLRVTVTGAPRLPLTIGARTVYADFKRSTDIIGGETNLIFEYIVAAGDSDADGISTGSAIDLNGGAIAATDGGAAAQLSLGVHAIANQATDIVDAVAPALVSATVTGDSLVLTYDKTLTDYNLPPADAWKVKVDGGAAASPTGVAVSGRTVTLTLAAAVAYGQTVTVSYTVPTGAGEFSLVDLVEGNISGNKAASFTDRAVINNSPGIVLSRTALTVGEGGTATYTVRLNSAPSATVTVTVARASGGSTDVTFDTDADAANDQNTLTFTTANWSTAQTVTVRAARDADTMDDSATLSHGARGGGYDSYTADLAVTVSDDITPGIVLSTAALSVTEGGEAAYTVRLNTAPSGDGDGDGRPGLRRLRPT